jgi:hypothetical protein
MFQACEWAKTLSGGTKFPCSSEERFFTSHFLLYTHTRSREWIYLWSDANAILTPLYADVTFLVLRVNNNMHFASCGERCNLYWCTNKANVVSQVPPSLSVSLIRQIKMRIMQNSSLRRWMRASVIFHVGNLNLTSHISADPRSRYSA